MFKVYPEYKAIKNENGYFDIVEINLKHPNIHNKKIANQLAECYKYKNDAIAAAKLIKEEAELKIAALEFDNMDSYEQSIQDIPIINWKKLEKDFK